MDTVWLGSLGGTIAMTEETQGGGVVPNLGASQLIAAIPELADVARIEAETLLSLPSASLTFEQIIDVLTWARDKVRAGAHSVVITQGTDTLEETSYLLDLFWTGDAPLIVTGAMRSASGAGSDGPANLLAAVRVAVAEESRGRGVLVVMNDTIHAARRVMKSDALSVQAFTSPVTGPLGVMIEGRPTYFHGPLPRKVLQGPVANRHQIALLEASFSDTTHLIEHAARSGQFAGIVVAALGAGHVSTAYAEVIGEFARALPILIATRTGANATATATYGYPGSEIDLIRRGAIMAGWRSPRKARILLWALIAAGLEGEALRASIANWTHDA
jgi:L-asparaginase